MSPGEAKTITDAVQSAFQARVGTMFNIMCDNAVSSSMEEAVTHFLRGLRIARDCNTRASEEIKNL